MMELASLVVVICMFVPHISTANGLLAEEGGAQLLLHQFFPASLLKSCLKQPQPKKRTTLLASSNARQQQGKERRMVDNNMNDFASFLDQLSKRYPQFIIKNDKDDVYMTILIDTGSQVSQLNRGGLSIPKLSTTYFVHTAVHIISKLSPSKSLSRQYLARLLSVDAPLSGNIMACRTVANILLKAHVLHHSDRQQDLGCLCLIQFDVY